MKRILILLALLTATASAQTQVCKIYGYVDSVAGKTSALTTTKAQITVTRAAKSGSLFLNTSRTFPADENGRIEFYAPRTVGTDTAVIHIRANFGDLAAGQLVYVPAADSAELRQLPRYTANPTFVVVAVPSGGGSGDTSLNGHPRLTRIEDVEGQFTASTSDSLQQAAANVFVARNVAEGKAGADSVHTVLVALSNLIAGKGSADSIHTSLVTLYNLVAGKPNADSVHTAIAAMLKMSDTTALHAQKFAVINDSLFAVSLRATSTANDLTAHASTADAHLPSQTGQAGKVLGTNGTVSAWRTLDRTYITRNDTCIVIDSSTAGIYIVTLNPNCRGGGAAVDTLRFVSIDRDDTIKGEKTFAGKTAFIDTLIAPYGKGISFGHQGSYANSWIGTANGLTLEFRSNSGFGFIGANSSLTVGEGGNQAAVSSGGFSSRSDGGTPSLQLVKHPRYTTYGYDGKGFFWSYLNQYTYATSKTYVRIDTTDTVTVNAHLIVPAGNITVPTGKMSARTITADSSLVGVLVIDTTRRVSAVGDSITFILTELRAPLSPAKGRKSGYVVFDFTSELPYGFCGSGVMMHTIIADTASGVRIEAASYNTWGTRDGNPDYSFHAEQTLFWASHAKTTKATTGFAQDATWTMRTPGSTQQSRWNMRLNTTYIYQNLMAGRVTIRYTMPQGNNSISPIRVVGGWI